MRRLPDDQQEPAGLATPPRAEPGTVTRAGRRRSREPRGRRNLFTIGGALIAVAAIVVGVGLYNESASPPGPLPVTLPRSPASYLGVFASGVPASFAPVTSFAKATGTEPDLAMYYSGWFVPFPAPFAATAAQHGAVPLVQMDPDKPGATISIAAITSGKYDPYLSQYAEAVRAYKHPVILSFGHEMNGDWSPWGYKHTPAAVFVAAWRHIVDLFRTLGARNVTWLWTVNIVNDARSGKVTSPKAWWPGSSYVTWVGVDGYYLKPSWQFAPLFGPTLSDVHSLTTDPVLIAETGALQSAGQPAKINDLFAGIRAYGLLGFVWFDNTNTVGQHFGLGSPAAFAAFRKGASSYRRPGS
jgi:mannan endo-1,4-beta-mannosidase